MIVVQGDFTIKPGKRDEAIAAMTKVAKATQQEAGCIRYNFYADLEDPNRFIVYEEWESQAHLDAHLASDNPPPHMVETLSEILMVTRRMAIHSSRESWRGLTGSGPNSRRHFDPV